MEANANYFRLLDFSGFIRKKDWGTTLRLEGLNPNDLHIACVNYGTSSIHCHHRLFNFIYKLEGTLSIYFPTISEIIELHDNEAIEINPGVKHKFEGTEAIILESYYTQPLRSVSHLDIERFPND